MKDWLHSLMPHLILAPVLLPMGVAALILLLGEERQRIKLTLSLMSCLSLLGVAVFLLQWSHQQSSATTMGVYLTSNWPAQFGITLVLDRLAALMLTLTALLALASAIYASARWHRAGVHFHALFQLQLMGLNGLFLTGDLFNLFVFIEILLAASYGLLLHGSGRFRVQAGLHYIAINLLASSLLLIGISMLYGITGTLNLAHMASIIPYVADEDRSLLHAAAGVLGVALLIKAAVWPMNFWLTRAYSAATAPAGALFAIMTKVGIYMVLRLWTLLFGYDAGPSAQYGGQWLTYAGMATIAVGSIGVLSSQKLGNLAGYSAIVSSGTLLAAMGFGQNLLTAGLLYYLVSSTLAISACFLLADLMDRWRNDGADYAPYEAEDEAPFLTADLQGRLQSLNLDEREQALVGQPMPAAVALLGLGFMACTLLIAGLPPLSGFIGKFTMLTALLNPLGMGGSSGQQLDRDGWLLLALLIGSGLLALIALSRAGIRHFWASHDRNPPLVKIGEGIPLALLLGCCVTMTVQADDVMRYMQTTANALYAPDDYIQSVLQTQVKPYPTQTTGSAAGSAEAGASVDEAAASAAATPGEQTPSGTSGLEGKP
ncbi:monovalent cation/H+ antiporter subunit D [Vandammella animalimorsus]|uniref:Monovalent cation/H+ antiporter subunit D n=1 Tax=Vandammella animalimorsus TaxID=2029117 RepID=A0A2A2T3R3_9BURK|nr:monovalent cation/H+ antiporter subunit D [Vandammella animalimorsus]PAT31239.1 monovalent cation/H+ antiporter subunit D [Vandammella animalimorsus]PAX16068.1 monovalent cation/H+ antiporter subunit D [Vandammella animalimorsus]PAX20238.1 monovalent cation/H+ antiporter subunit D [Vandammella animalimorsus]